MESYTEDEGLNTNYVFSFCEDRQGILWVGTDKGLLKFNNGKWKIFDSDTGLPGSYITMILPSGNGLLLFISEKGVYHFDESTGKISPNLYGKGITVHSMYRSKADAEFAIVQYTHNNTEKFDAVSLNNPTARIPLSTEHQVLSFVQNGRTKSLGRIDEQYQNFTTVPYRDMELKIMDRVGIVRYRKGEIVDTISNKNGLGTNLLMNTYQAKSGDIYIGTLGSGFAVLKHRNPKTTFNLQHHKIRKLQYVNGKYYFISNGVLYRTDQNLNTQQIPVRKDALTFFIKDDILNVGAFSGFYQYKLSSDRLIEINHQPSTAGISAMFAVGDKIISSTYGVGISENGVRLNTTGFPFSNIENFFKTTDGFAFVSYQSGFFTTDENFKVKQYFTKENGLLSNYVTVVFPKGNLLFVGTTFGFTVFENNRLKRIYTDKNGFRGTIVRNIFEDTAKNIWVVSDQNIMKLEGNQLVSYGSLKTIGQQKDLIQRCFFNPDKNELFVASKNKFSLMKLNELSPDRTPPVPKLIGVSCKGIEMIISNVFTVDRDNYNTVFEFEPVYKNPVSEAHLFYKIDNENWQAFADNNILRINHLDVGDHKIWVKTVNSDGYESYYPETIEVKVNNYFYHSWWFYVLSLLVFGAIVTYFFYRYNESKFERKMQQIAIQNEIENERKRISRDLHDNIGAYTTSLISKVDQLKNEIPTEGEKIDDIRQSAGFIMNLLRQTIFVLNSQHSTMENYVDTFLNYCIKFFKTYPHINFQLEEDITNNRVLDSTVAINGFRVLQEALQNIVKHSEATEVKVRILSHEKILLEIIDNGKGFDATKQHSGFGLINMQERAQELGYALTVKSDSNGTVISLREK